MKLKPEIKALWVAKLRSGEIDQIKGTLRDNKGMCCLGVLCDLVDPEGWALGIYSEYRHNGSTGLPSFSVTMEVFGDAPSSWSEVEVEIGGDTTDLARHNDTGATFAEIADAIEAQL